MPKQVVPQKNIKSSIGLKTNRLRDLNEKEILLLNN